MAAPKKVAEAIFRLAQVVASPIVLVLLQKLALELLLPPWLATAEALFLSYGRLPVLIVSGFAVSVVAFWGFGGMLALPAMFHVRRWKIQANRSMDFAELRRALPQVVFNFVLGTTLVPVILNALLPDSSFSWKDLPTTKTLVRDALVWLAAEEVLFFYLHRWMHEDKWMYQKYHKLHHTWTAPISLVAIYCHPVEHLLCNILPLMVGPVLCGSHLVPILVFLFGGQMHTCAVHSGYWAGNDGMHDEHHNKFTVNYGVLGVMDVLYGTYRLPEGAGADADAAKRS